MDSQDMQMLILRFEMALERLGKATRQRFGDATVWEITSPNLLTGMEQAARASLRDEGVADVQGAIDASLQGFPLSPFLALRSLLSEESLTKLVNRFEGELTQ